MPALLLELELELGLGLELGLHQGQVRGTDCSNDNENAPNS